ncbi:MULTISPECIES: hypothetical protein [Streptomyces]|uniref:Lipoprotein n=1 Tax=Streptomyces durocortorensis TaxID=2811104 RepID=A0ABS2I5J6_9ACTN|nr:hypothetical protein [Streptomyces durocortorensis]MBM7057398.1 hypothetical protein [Streptomyces durocortorensis]
MSRTSNRGRLGLLGAVIAVSLAAGAVGCTDGETAGATPDWSTGPTELCGGEAVSVEAGEALKVITGSSRFEGSGPEYTLAQAVRAMRERLAFAVVGDGDICRVYGMSASPMEYIEVTWELTGGPPKGEPASKFTVLPMGERALTAPDAAAVQFACQSAKLPGSTPTHIDIGVQRWLPMDPEGDPEKLKDAYATVVHSFALAMAKELRCENDGGLEARPSLDPA